MADIKLVLIDWGNTVMVDIPDYSGPMAKWPRVEAVPGAESVVKKLSSRFPLVLASNAEESGNSDARQALDRIGLGEYFQNIFTARDIGVGKEDPAYYLKIIQELDVLPEEAVMVGDSYQGDVINASRAGLKTVWLNPEGNACPQTHPQHEAEIERISELPLALDHMDLPTLPRCLEYLRQEEASDNLIQHCLAVGACAYWTSTWMKEADINVDPLLSHRGGILHDLDKITGRKRDLKHGEWSGQLLREKGFRKLARIAERHVITKILDRETPPETWEEKLVFYIDKLIEGGSFAGLEPRMQALRNRYPQFASQMKTSMPLIKALESQILELLGLSQEAYYSRLAVLDFSQYKERI